MASSVELLTTMEDLVDAEFKKFKWFLQQSEVLEGFPAIPKSQLENADRMDTVDELMESYDKNAVEVTIKVLKIINKNDLVQRLLTSNPMSKETLNDCLRKFKSTLREKNQRLFTQAAKSGKEMSKIYTGLNITDENLECAVNIAEVFEALPGKDGSIRTLLTKGESGIGKTLMTQKFALDWAEDKVNNNIQFMFPFTFRELNLLYEKKYSWVELLHHVFADLKEAGIYSFDKLQIVFLLDGLDECHLPLDFLNNEILTDVTDSASVDVLLTNLIMGKLFPSACIWMTTTPEAAGRIPKGYIDMATEVRGFTDLKKEEYFRKRFKNKELASQVIAHINRSQSLHTLCRIPMFCWITATVLADIFVRNDRGRLPKTMTEMYVHFLLDQSKLANVNYYGRAETYPLWNTETSKMVLSLGKLAFEQLQKGNVIFHEADLKGCGVDIRATSVYSGVFSQIVIENRGLKQEKLFCFAHLSFQAFLAAIHVFASFINSGISVLSEEQSTSQQCVPIAEQSSVKHLFQGAVNESLQSPNGSLDLFLRFLAGLSLQNNKALLQGLLDQSGSILQSNHTAEFIKKKIREKLSPEKCINLFHCLNELNDHSLEEELQQYLSSLSLSEKKLSPAQWSALVCILLASEKRSATFDLKRFYASEDGLLRLLPVVQASSISLLNCCKLSWKSCKVLASVLCSPSSNLRELDLSDNKVMQQSVQDLTDGLKNPQCRLETLRLSGCHLTSMSCGALCSVLSCQSSSLKELDLTSNDLEDSGVETLSVGLASPQCRLEILRLVACGLTWKACDAVGFFLDSPSSCLTQLDLSMNNLQNSGVLMFTPGLMSPHCKLEVLWLRACDLSGKVCEALASVLALETSSLRVLDLSNNSLEDSGVKLLSTGLESPHCTLETLRLNHSKVTERSCGLLATALSSQSSGLKELVLSNNDLQDSGVKLLSTGLRSPQCQLEILRLSGCQLTEDGCSSLASALSLSPSPLTELDLSYNHPGAAGAELLSARLQDPQRSLDTLKLDHGGVERLKSGLQKYACELRLDPNTAHRQLMLSDDGRQVKYQEEEQPYQYHPDRFDVFKQVLCSNALTGRCYWEIETKGRFYVGVTYHAVRRRGGGNDCRFGGDEKSWSLYCNGGCSIWHNNSEIQIRSQLEGADKVALYLDWPAGTLSFYRVSPDALTHIYTVYSRFTQPLYPSFGFEFRFSNGFSMSRVGSSVSLCQTGEGKTSVRHPE